MATFANSGGHSLDALTQGVISQIISYAEKLRDGSPVLIISTDLKRYIADQGVSKDQFLTALSLVFSNPEHYEKWLTAFQQHGVTDVFSVEHSGYSSAAPITRIQGPQTTLQPTPVASPASRRRQSVADSIEDESAMAQLYSGNLTIETSAAQLSKVVVGDRGTGVTTFLKVMIYWLSKNYPSMAVRIISTEITPYLGYERSPDRVTYVSGDMLEILPDAAAQVGLVYKNFKNRIDANRNALTSGEPVPEWEPFLLVVTRWNVIYSNLKDMTKAEQKSHGCASLLNQVKTLIQQGDQVNVTVLLASDSHKKEHTGLDYPLLRSCAIVGIGCVRQGQTGGHLALRDLISESSIFPETVRNALKKAYKRGVNKKLPMVFSSAGTPRLSRLPDYSSIDSKVVDYAGMLTEMGIAS